jgi:hypothetical protein
MCFHPAYPSRADLSHEAQAIHRDLADIATLRELHTIVSIALARSSQCDTIHHPDTKWTTDDLLETLQGALTDIDGTAQLIRRSPLVLEMEG